jgi:hypothetical protein
MKFGLLSFVYFLFFGSITAQGQYAPMVEEGKYWIYLNLYDYDPLRAVSGHAITFQGDTIINSLSYKKVYKHLLKGGHPCMYPPCWQFTYPYQTESKSLISLIMGRHPIQKNIQSSDFSFWFL